LKIYHNTKCSKSRQALQLLQDKGCEFEIIEYLNTPLDKEEIFKIIAMLDVGPRDIMRKKEPEYTANGLDNPDLSAEELVQAIVTTPKLLERPIVVCNGKAAVGRPPENILKII